MNENLNHDLDGSDDRKRTFESNDLSGQLKRFRPEEILADGNDPTKVITRLLLNRAEFSKLIGKGGQMISHIRSSIGVTVKGTDIDEDTRLVLITGGFFQVLKAFEVISELIVQAATGATGYDNHAVYNRDIAVNILLEHIKAGKIVGSKGSTINGIKTKSGANIVRIEKEPKEYSGVSLRKLVMDGSLQSVRRAHYLVLELFVDPLLLMRGAGPAGSNMIDQLSIGGFYQMHQQQQQQQGHGYNNNYINDSPRADAYSNMHTPQQTGLNNGQVSVVPLPFSSLVGYGLQVETVRQLTEMKGYLSRHFGLELIIARENSLNSSMYNQTGMGNNYVDSGAYNLQGGGNNVQSFGNGSNRNMNQMINTSPNNSIEAVIAARKAIANPNSELCFAIPKAFVGGVIGKGGQILKDLQAEFNTRVYVEKEEFSGKRLVVLTYLGPNDSNNVNGKRSGEFSELGMNSLLNCQAKIMSIIEDQQQQQLYQQSGGIQNNNSHLGDHNDDV